MAKKSETKKVNTNQSDNSCTRYGESSWGAYYGLGVMGAAVYFVGQATGFWTTILALVKALVWPVFLVYGLLGALGL
jgi:hypothetical protein